MRTHRDESDSDHPFAGPLLIAGSVIIFCLSAAALVHRNSNIDDFFVFIARNFAFSQDIPVAIGMIMFYLLFAAVISHTKNKEIQLNIGEIQAVILIFLLAGLICFFRVYLLFDYDLSRDEKMATFDSITFGQGRLFYPIPPFWQTYYHALNDLFLLPIGDREGFVSSYLPVNAALRGLMKWIVPANFVSPILVLIAGIALWRISRRLWPDSPTTQTVVLLLFAGSSQVIVMGTTTYAMTAHMTFNVLWLWLFLQRRPIASAGAIGLGFFATGLHQPIFHPLFVAPFFEILRRERRWKEFATFAAGYSCIGLFWLIWPNWLSGLGHHRVLVGTAGIGFLERIWNSIGAADDNSFWIMGANMLRFFAWQHLLLLPLAIIALIKRRKDPLVVALALGIVLLLAVILLLMPEQAWGWGYRYLHGYIVSFVLLGGYGWHWLEQRQQAPARTMALATALSLLIVLPIHVWMARQFTAPFANVSGQIARIPADVVIVDDNLAPFALDLIINRPDLVNKPLLFRASRVDPKSLGPLCHGRSLAFVDARMFGPIFGVLSIDAQLRPSWVQIKLHTATVAAGCRIVS